MLSYDDSIMVKMQEGLNSGYFHVPVRALISKLVVETPFGVDLGYCATHQTTSVTFLMNNTGEVDSPFRWAVPAPFILEPSSGIIPAKRSQEITVRIFPKDASVYVSEATCAVGEGVTAIIDDPYITTRFSAIGKYAFITLSENNIAFGEVLSGTPADKNVKEVLLKNDSVVPADYQLFRHENDRDEVFEVLPKRGTIPPKGVTTVRVTYTALAPGTCKRSTSSRSN